VVLRRRLRALSSHLT